MKKNKNLDFIPPLNSNTDYSINTDNVVIDNNESNEGNDNNNEDSPFMEYLTRMLDEEKNKDEKR